MKRAKSQKSKQKLSDKFIRISVQFPKDLKKLSKERRNEAAGLLREMRRQCRFHNSIVGDHPRQAAKIDRATDKMLHDWNTRFSLGYNKRLRDWKDAA